VVVTEGADSASSGGLPAFPGARPFTRADSGRFFGRTAEAARLAQEWLQNRLTFLAGPAGIGKTSLLTAGVLPLVNTKEAVLLPVGRLCGEEGRSIDAYPVAALPREHNPYSLALLKSWSGGKTVTADLAGQTVDDFIGQRAQHRDPGVLVLAAIDQADDLFAATESRQQFRRRFLQDLASAVREQPALRLLVSVRSDILPRITEVIGDGTQFHLDSLIIENAREAASGPGLFTATTAEALVHAIRTARIVADGDERLVVADQVEPALLQIACAGLWESLRANPGAMPERELRLHAQASVDAALAGYCSEAVAAVAVIHEIPVGWLRTWLVDTFVTEAGALKTVMEAEGASVTADAPATVPRALEDRYLLRAYAGSRWYKLISERLIEPLRHLPDRTPLPPDPHEYLRAAERARNIGQHDLAARLAGRVLNIAPDSELRLHAQAHSLLGDLAYRQGHFAQADDRYQRAASLFAAVGDTRAVAHLLFAQARTLIDRNRLADAVQLLVGAVTRTPADRSLQLELDWAIDALAQQQQSPPLPFGFTSG
jgi:tetratricopeptide (TPR) repeat protein